MQRMFLSLMCFALLAACQSETNRPIPANVVRRDLVVTLEYDFQGSAGIFTLDGTLRVESTTYPQVRTLYACVLSTQIGRRTCRWEVHVPVVRDASEMVVSLDQRQCVNVLPSSHGCTVADEHIAFNDQLASGTRISYLGTLRYWVRRER